MAFYYLDSKGLHEHKSAHALYASELEQGTVLFYPSSQQYRVVHKLHPNGGWSDQKAHTKDIKRMKTALLIEGVEFD